MFVFLFAGLFLEEFVLLEIGFLSEPVLGIPFLLLLTEILCVIGYSFTKKYLYAVPDAAPTEVPARV